MQELVDGYAELVLACKLPKDMGGKTIQVYVNEEGLLKDMHPNVGGTHYARIVSPSRPLGMLRGPVVVLFGTKALWR